MSRSISGLLLLMLLLSAACSRANGRAPAIARHPPPAAFDRGSLDTIPAYDPDSRESWQADLRGYDLSALDLHPRQHDLLYAIFDDRTVRPPAGRMPQGFDPQRILELGKNPGLGVRELHRQGITGRGVGMAILDQMLPGGAGRARDHA